MGRIPGGGAISDEIPRLLIRSARLSVGSFMLSALMILIALYHFWRWGVVPGLMLTTYLPLLLWSLVAGGYGYLQVYRCAIEVVQELSRKAFVDETTGLLNVRYVHERAREEQERIKRYGGCCAILYVDLDGFKVVNDRFGHSTGDRVLRGLANVMRSNVRGSDTLARIGGDEFLALLPQTALEAAKVTAERLRTALEGFKWDLGDGHVVDFVRASIGVAAYPGHGDSMESAVAAADRAVYDAKKLGGNAVCLFVPQGAPGA